MPLKTPANATECAMSYLPSKPFEIYFLEYFLHFCTIVPIYYVRDEYMEELCVILLCIEAVTLSTIIVNQADVSGALQLLINKRYSAG